MGIDPAVGDRPHALRAKGVGALYVRRKKPAGAIAPMGGRRRPERGMRSGTVPVRWWWVSGRRTEISREVMAEESKRLAALRDRLQEQIVSKVDEPTSTGTRNGACRTT